MGRKEKRSLYYFYDALDKVAKQTNEDGYEVWKKALANVSPAVEVRSRRIGGATFQIPSEVRPDRKISLSIKWLIRYSRDRNGRSMADKLAGEIVAASKGEGAAFKRKKIPIVWLKPTRLLLTSGFKRYNTIALNHSSLRRMVFYFGRNLRPRRPYTSVSLNDSSRLMILVSTFLQVIPALSSMILEALKISSCSYLSDR